MRLYRTPAGSWAGTQDDAKALAKSEGSSWSMEEVAVDKPGLLAFFNMHRVGAPRERTERLEAPPVVREPEEVREPPLRSSMNASAILARMDNPGQDVDGIVERIATSRGHALKRYASAVALAFERLTT